MRDADFRAPALKSASLIIYTMLFRIPILNSMFVLDSYRSRHNRYQNTKVMHCGILESKGTMVLGQKAAV